MLKLGIIGKGFVGGAVDFGFDKKVEKMIVDPKYTTNTIKDLVNWNPEMLFICVPTPQDESGDIKISIAESVLEELNELQYTGIVIIKSTITPQHLSWFLGNFVNLRIVYNPEFLTEANANWDFCNPPMQILGGTWEDCTEVERAYVEHTSVKVVPTFKVDIISASMLKYAINSFLATKVIWMNELHELHSTSGAETSWNDFTDMLKRDPRIGTSHLKVPGPDGFFGFGGHCFPKDTAALLHYAGLMGVDLSVLDMAVKKNKEIRNEENDISS